MWKSILYTASLVLTTALGREYSHVHLDFAIVEASDLNSQSEVYPDNAMSAMSTIVGADIPEFLIRRAAENKRREIRKENLSHLRQISEPGGGIDQLRLQSWEEQQKDGNHLRRVRDRLINGLHTSPNAVVVNIAEGVWKYYRNSNYDTTKDILPPAVFHQRYKESGYVTTEKSGYATTEKFELFCYTSKSAYYQSGIVNAGNKYDKLMLDFTNAIKKVNAWETEMLAANNVQSDTSTFESEELYGKILEAWEARA